MAETYGGYSRSRLLMIDDDEELVDLLTEFLGAEGLRVESQPTAEDGLKCLASDSYDLVLLDVMLPGVSGLEALRRIRANSSVPVLMLTAKGEDVDRIVGLELGADDYLPKPFNSRELLARIHAILRRTHAESPHHNGGCTLETLAVGDVTMHLGTREVEREGHAIELTGIEFNLLQELLGDAGRVVPRDVLFKNVLGRRFEPDDRSLDMHISNLRKKLGHKIGTVDRIKTVRGQGYIYARVDPVAD